MGEMAVQELVGHRMSSEVAGLLFSAIAPADLAVVAETNSESSSGTGDSRSTLSVKDMVHAFEVVDTWQLFCKSSGFASQESSESSYSLRETSAPSSAPSSASASPASRFSKR